MRTTTHRECGTFSEQTCFGSWCGPYTARPEELSPGGCALLACWLCAPCHRGQPRGGEYGGRSPLPTAQHNVNPALPPQAGASVSGHWFESLRWYKVTCTGATSTLVISFVRMVNYLRDSNWFSREFDGFKWKIPVNSHSVDVKTEAEQMLKVYITLNTVERREQPYPIWLCPML